ncbi:MAG TPA: dihydroorotase [Cyclobacteriaceae bacterium]|nr:dihydroorotase [Cyclobacteriaceae bacterium]
MSILLKSLKLVDEEVREVADYFYNGKEIRKADGTESSDNVQVIDCSGMLASRGWIDLRCFVGEPGLEHKETLSSLGETLKKSGFTEAVILPNTYPTVQSKNEVEFIKSRVKDYLTTIHVQGAVTIDTKGEDLTEILDVHHQGVRVFGEGTVPLSNSDRMVKVLQYLQKFDGILFDHSYDPLLSIFGHMHEGLTSTRLGLKGIPSMAEEVAVQKNIEILKYTGGSLHFQTISTAEVVRAIRKAKSDGLKVTSDVSLYQLLFTDEDLNDFDTNLKVMPPFRGKKDRMELIEGLKDGTIDAIVSNHQPQDLDSKHMEFDLASFGMVGLPGFLSGLIELEGELGWPLLISKITDGPAKVLRKEKSTLSSLTIFDPQEEWRYDRKSNPSLGQNSPWFNSVLKGRVKYVINNGKFDVVNG